MIGAGISTSQRRPAAGSPTAAVMDWESRIVANGGTISAAAKAAAITLVGSLQSIGLWDKLDRFNPFSGSDGSATENLAGSLVPLVNRIGSAVDTIVNGGPGNYDVAFGMISDGSMYLRTEAPPQNIIGGMGLALSGGAATGNRTFAGCTDTGVGCRFFAPSTSSYRGANWGSSSISTIGAAGGYNGLHFARRRTLTDLVRGRNGTLQQRDTAADAGDIPAFGMHVFAGNVRGSASQALPAGQRFAGYFFFSGIVDDGVTWPNPTWAAIHAALQTYFASLGRTLP